MDEAEIILKAKALRTFPKLAASTRDLGFSSISSTKTKLVLEKIETTDLKGSTHHFYRAEFHPDKLIFTYSLGLNKKKRELDALIILLHLLKMSEAHYQINAGELYHMLSSLLNEMRVLSDSESYTNTQQLLELRENLHSLEKKYKDVVFSSEQNTRILLECEKKRDEYYLRIKQLEGMSENMLIQEIFKWLKTHVGEINISQFAKSYNLPTSRVEEGLEYLLKNGYIRKR